MDRGIGDFWQFCLNTALLLLLQLYLLLKQANNIMICVGCYEWTLIFLNSKLSSAQDDFVNANKVFLTKDTKKCTQWEIGYISQWQLSKEGIKYFPDRDCLDQVKGCSDKSQKIKNSVIVIRSDQDEFLHATREIEMYWNSKGCLTFLQDLGNLLCIIS